MTTPGGGGPVRKTLTDATLITAWLGVRWLITECQPDAAVPATPRDRTSSMGSSGTGSVDRVTVATCLPSNYQVSARPGTHSSL